MMRPLILLLLGFAAVLIVVPTTRLIGIGTLVFIALCYFHPIAAAVLATAAIAALVLTHFA